MRPSLLSDLNAVVGAAFAAEGLDAALGRVQPSDRPDLGQFQSSGALAAARAAKSNPRALAEKIKARLDADARLTEISIAGPGFLNFSVTDEVLDSALAEGEALLAADSSGERGKIVLDFGGPNVAKAMHVGHLRSSIIGDALQRHHRFAGFATTSDVHLGDWGKPMGMIIGEMLLHAAPSDPVAAAALAALEASDLKPVAPGIDVSDRKSVTLDDLGLLYPVVAAATREKAFDAFVRKVTERLQRQEAPYIEYWHVLRDVSVAGMWREFGSLGIQFDLWKGESDVNEIIPRMLADLKERGIAEVSDGALVVRIGQNTDKRELPPLILVKSDGGVLYETTDVATIIDRVETFDPDLVLYIVDQRQHEHFEKVFRVARKAGYTGRAVLEHTGFGTMNGADGKPFKTRAGGVLKLYDLIEMGKAEAAARLDEAGIGADYPAEERDEIARQVGLAAIKFADLSNHRLTNYIFDLARFSRFEGKTGPYLQYAAVRVKSLLRKASEEGVTAGAIAIHASEERDLALALLRFPEALEETLKLRAPNVMCDWAFNLAQGFSRFYGAHHILSETDAVLRASRLALAALTLKALETALDLLGIEVPERM